MLNPDYRESFWYFDSKGMILEQLGWSADHIGSGGDIIGRNAFAYICWPNSSYLKDSILQCIRMGDDGYLQFYRYPGIGANTISRDHIGAIILAFYVNRDFEELEWILENLPWKLSRKYSQTIDFWLWQKSIKWKSFWSGQIFYLLNIIFFSIVVPWNLMIRKILKIKKLDRSVDPSIDRKYVEFKPGSWKWILNRTIYPHFALFLLSWQIRILPKSWLKYILQKLLLLESNNIVISAALGKKITKEEYDQYHPISAFIWSRRFDTTDDIYLKWLTESEYRYNDLNKGMLDYLYFQIDKVMLEFDDSTVKNIKNGRQIVDY